MSELAFNKEGDRFDPVENAAYWRPRLVRDRGLNVVYRKGGCTPVTLPIDATEEEFREAVARPGKYRLDQLDEDYQPIPGAPPAYVYVQGDHDAAENAADVVEPAVIVKEPRGAKREPAGAGEMSEFGHLLFEMVRLNFENNKVITERFAEIIGATAHLVRAADGAGMPARDPVALRNAQLETPAAPAEPDDEEDEESPTATWADVAKACVEKLDVFLGLAGVGKPRVRNAASKDAPAAPPPKPAGDAGAAPEITGEMRAHLFAIFARLTSEEQAFAREVVNELTETERAHWMRELATMSVGDAVALFRKKMECAS